MLLFPRIITYLTYQQYSGYILHHFNNNKKTNDVIPWKNTAALKLTQ